MSAWTTPYTITMRLTTEDTPPQESTFGAIITNTSPSLTRVSSQ